MPQFPSLPPVAHLSDLLMRFPKNIEPLMAYINALLRSEGALSIGDREMIAAYVSGLNACRFCRGSHEIYATAFGVPPTLVQQLLDNPGNAEIDTKYLALLAYVKKLNQLPSKLVEADAKAVFDAGWPEEALFEAVEVAAAFNMMNRIVEGSGVNFDYAGNTEGHTIASGDPEALANSYVNFAMRMAERMQERRSAPDK